MEDKEDGAACFFLHQIIDSALAPAQPTVFPPTYFIILLHHIGKWDQASTSLSSRSKDSAPILTFGGAASRPHDSMLGLSPSFNEGQIIPIKSLIN